MGIRQWWQFAVVSAGTMILFAICTIELRSVSLEETSSSLLKSYGKEADMINGPTDAEDGTLYNAPSRQARLGTIHSKDIFQQGLQIAKLQESQFEAQVTKEKEKDLAHQLNALRHDIHSKHHRLTATSVWNHIESTADLLFKGLSDIRTIKKPLKRSVADTKININIEAPAASLAITSRPKSSLTREVRNDGDIHSQNVAPSSSSTESHHERWQKSPKTSRRDLAPTEGLAELTTAVRRRVHRTRPGETGGVVCAPPFCDGADLPAILPGESAAVAERQVWQRMAGR